MKVALVQNLNALRSVVIRASLNQDKEPKHQERTTGRTTHDHTHTEHPGEKPDREDRKEGTNEHTHTHRPTHTDRLGFIFHLIEFLER